MAIVGEEYRSEKLSDGTFTVFDVPIFAETTDDRDSFDVCEYDKDLLGKIVARHKELEEGGHCKPIHLGHHEGQENKRNIGSIVNLRIKDVDGVATVFADFTRIPEDVYKDLCDGRIPYRSVEIDLDDERPCFSSLSLLSTQDPYFEFPNMNVKSVVFCQSGREKVLFCRMPQRKIRVIFDFRKTGRKQMRKRRHSRGSRKFMGEKDWQIEAAKDSMNDYIKVAKAYYDDPSFLDDLPDMSSWDDLLQDAREEFAYIGMSGSEYENTAIEEIKKYMLLSGQNMYSKRRHSRRPTARRRRFAEVAIGEIAYNEEELLGVMTILENCQFDLGEAIKTLTEFEGVNFIHARDLVVQAIDIIAKSQELIESVGSVGMMPAFRKAKQACKMFGRQGRTKMRKRRHIRRPTRRRRFAEGDTAPAPADMPAEADTAPPAKQMTMDMSDYVTADEFDEFTGKLDDLSGMVADLTGKVDEILAGKPQEPAPPVAEDTSAPEDGADKTQMSKRGIQDRVRQLEMFAKAQKHSQQVDGLIMDLRKMGSVFNEEEVRSTATQFANIGQKAFKRYAKSLLVNSSGPIHMAGLNVGIDDLTVKYSKDPEAYQAARMADDYFSQNQRQLTSSGITRAAWIEGEVIKFNRSRRNGRNRNL